MEEEGRNSSSAERVSGALGVLSDADLKVGCPAYFQQGRAAGLHWLPSCHGTAVSAVLQCWALCRPCAVAPGCHGMDMQTRQQQVVTMPTSIPCMHEGASITQCYWKTHLQPGCSVDKVSEDPPHIRGRRHTQSKYRQYQRSQAFKTSKFAMGIDPHSAAAFMHAYCLHGAALLFLGQQEVQTIWRHRTAAAATS